MSEIDKILGIMTNYQFDPKIADMIARLCVLVKYTQFDLEATRRDNQFLRQQLDTKLE